MVAASGTLRPIVVRPLPPPDKTSPDISAHKASSPVPQMLYCRSEKSTALEPERQKSIATLPLNTTRSHPSTATISTPELLLLLPDAGSKVCILLARCGCVELFMLCCTSGCCGGWVWGVSFWVMGGVGFGQDKEKIV